jgi:LacI family transcriptional regulator
MHANGTTAVRRRIGLVLDRHITYCRGILRGIYSYVQPGLDLEMRLVSSPLENVRLLRDWGPTGVIANITRVDLAQALEAFDLPVINVSGAINECRLPRVGIDDEAIGTMAAEYLVTQGFRHFAYSGWASRVYSQKREAAYRSYLQQHGHDCSSYDSEPVIDAFDSSAGSRDAELSRWLRTMPNPVGIFCSNDERALWIRDVCRQIGLRVPEDVALVGVDDDELICRIMSPPLSSVSTPIEQVGREAARLLERLMNGEAAPEEAILLPPTRVVGRRSSEVVAVGDSHVTAALQFIQQHAREPLSVKQVLDAVPISRSWLERRFKELLGRTPAEEIERVQLGEAKRLLSDTNLAMSEVAENSGFSSASRLSHTFRRATGLTPSAYRQRFRDR